MLVLFFTIIFIAELIVTTWLISLIINLDKTVCELNQKVLTIQPEIKDNIQITKNIISQILSGLDCFTKFISTKREDCKNALKQNLLSTIAGFILRIPVKKIIALINIVLTIKKFIKI